jgi:hypothetical protein
MPNEGSFASLTVMGCEYKLIVRKFSYLIVSLRIFARDLIDQGRSGGLNAARMLKSAIETDMASSPQFKLWIFCFLNKQGLAAHLQAGRTKESDFNAFLTGFNMAGGKGGGRNYMIDIGYGKEVADSRIRGHHSLFTHGSGHSNACI